MRQGIHRLARNFSRATQSEFNNRRTRRIDAILGKTGEVRCLRWKDIERETKKGWTRRENTKINGERVRENRGKE